MKTLCIFLVLLGSAHAATIEVIGRIKTPILRHEFEADLSKSVGFFTVSEFQAAKLEFDGTEGGIVSIANFKNEVEVISDKEMKAYGWCYSVNGLAPDLMPDQAFFTSQQDVLKWFYAYSEYKNGEWISQCVPLF